MILIRILEPGMAEKSNEIVLEKMAGNTFLLVSSKKNCAHTGHHFFFKKSLVG